MTKKGLPIRRIMLVTYRNAFKAGGILKCGIYHQPIRHKSEVSLDHILPKYRGGRDEPSNFQPTHRKCNQDKGGKFQHEVEVSTVPLTPANNKGDKNDHYPASY